MVGLILQVQHIIITQLLFTLLFTRHLWSIVVIENCTTVHSGHTYLGDHDLNRSEMAFVEVFVGDWPLHNYIGNAWLARGVP